MKLKLFRFYCKLLKTKNYNKNATKQKILFWYYDYF